MIQGDPISGLWSFSTILLVFVSINDELSAGGLTIGRPCECLPHSYAVLVLFLLIILGLLLLVQVVFLE